MNYKIGDIVQIRNKQYKVACPDGIDAGTGRVISDCILVYRDDGWSHFGYYGVWNFLKEEVSPFKQFTDKGNTIIRRNHSAIG
jgi:hypothetical protein